MTLGFLARWLIVASLLAGTAAAYAADDDEPSPLTIFAAASLQGSLDEVADAWTRESGRKVVISYAASSALARQIEQGAPADVFLSADSEWMDWLAARGRIDAASRVDLLGNELVLVAPRSAPAVLTATPRELLPGDLGRDGRLAVAEVETVPAGKYAKQALQAIDRWDAVADRLAQAENVRAALAFVARGEAPLGIVYATDAKAEPDVRVVARFPADTHALILYPVASIAGRTTTSARDFLAYLRSRTALCIFLRAGFLFPSATWSSPDTEDILGRATGPFTAIINPCNGPAPAPAE